MIVEEVMTHGIESIDDLDTLSDAAALMAECNIGLLAVLNPRNDIIGVVSDRDIVIRGFSLGLEILHTPVIDVTTMGMVTCRCDASVEVALQLMKKYKIRRLITVDPNGYPIGIVSLGDIAARVPEKWLVDDVLEQICRSSGSISPTASNHCS